MYFVPILLMGALGCQQVEITSLGSLETLYLGSFPLLPQCWGLLIYKGSLIVIETAKEIQSSATLPLAV